MVSITDGKHSGGQTGGGDGDGDRDPLIQRVSSFTPSQHHPKAKLSLWPATSICGNDILSSCFYTIGLTIDRAGSLAPFSLILVALLLYFFRQIYEELGSALRVNGGIYTVMINTSSKKIAALTGSISLLSYTATAVVSANSAYEYLNYVVTVNSHATTIAILILFCVLMLIGLKESSLAALIMFAVNSLSLFIFVAIGIVYAFTDDWSTFGSNWAKDSPDGYSYAESLFFGFSSGLLGISGFETAANYIEQQEKGVYRSVLRNLWALNSFFNPLIAVIALATLSMSTLGDDDDFLLSAVAEITVGGWFGTWMAINGLCVLSFSVLTSYVGVQGVVCRMSQDRILPVFLQDRNASRGTLHWCIVSFCALCITLYLLLSGKMESLTSVYTVAFVSVMIMYAFGLLMVRRVRDDLPRSRTTATYQPQLVCVCALLGLAGMIYLELGNVIYGLIPLGIIWVVMAVSMFDVQLLRALAAVSGCLCLPRLQQWLANQAHGIQSKKVIYFVKDESIETIRAACHYILANEQRRSLHLIHFYPFSPEDVPAHLAPCIEILHGEFSQLSISFTPLHGKFSPEALVQLEEDYLVPRNFMFVGCPSGRARWSYDQMAGLRIITANRTEKTHSDNDMYVGRGNGNGDDNDSDADRVNDVENGSSGSENDSKRNDNSSTAGDDRLHRVNNNRNNAV